MGNVSEGSDSMEELSNFFPKKDNGPSSNIREIFNVIFCIEHFEYHFPADCIHEILSFLPRCYLCRKSVIEGCNEDGKSFHDYCDIVCNKPYNCILCDKPCEKEYAMTHPFCFINHVRNYRKLYDQLGGLDLRSEIDDYYRRLICYGILIKKIGNTSGKLIKVKIKRSFGSFEESNKKKEKKEYYISYRGILSDKETTITPPYNVEIKLIECFIYIIIKKKIFLFREDQLCVVFRFLEERLVTRAIPEIQEEEKEEEEENNTRKIKMSLLPKKFREKKFQKLMDRKYEVIQEIFYSPEGFFKNFFPIHGLYGLIRLGGSEYRDHPFLNRYLRKYEFKNRTNEFFRKMLLEEGQLLPGENLQSLTRPRNCFFSRQRVGNQLETFRGKNLTQICHLNVVLVDTLFEPKDDDNDDSFLCPYIKEGYDTTTLRDNKIVDSEDIQVKIIIFFDGMYFIWDKNELLVPKKSVVYENPFFRCHFKTVTFEQPKNYLASHYRFFKVLERYNLKYRYCSKKKRNIIKGQRNEFDFASEVFSVMTSHSLLRLPPKEEVLDFGYPFEKNIFFKTLRDYGKSGLRISYAKDFCDKFGLEEGKCYEFKTHLELDMFVRNLDKNGLVFVFDFPKERAILEAFDAIFWIRHFKFPNNPNYKPLIDQNGRGCPFGDPTKSHAYNRNYF